MAEFNVFTATRAELQARIAELENDEVRQRLANAEQQLYMAELAKNNIKASRKVQFRKRKAAEKRISELEQLVSHVVSCMNEYDIPECVKDAIKDKGLL